MPILSKILGFLGMTQLPLEASLDVVVSFFASLKSRDIGLLRSSLWWPLGLWLLPKSNVRKLWAAVDSMLGPVESFTPPELHKDGPLGVRTLKSLVRFQRGRLGVSVKLWVHRVIGVNVHAPIAIGLTPEWEAPEYVDEEAIREEEILVKSSMIWPRVMGTLTVPKREGRKQAVLMVPGSGPGDRDLSLGANKVWKDLAWGLASAGFVVLRMDKPFPLLVFKQMVTKTITMHDEYVPGHVAGLKYLAEHPEVDARYMFVLGGSMGGTMAPRICAASSVPVAGMISLAGASRPLLHELLDQFAYLQEHFPKPTEKYEQERAAVEGVIKFVENGEPASRWKTVSKDLPIPLPYSYLLDDYKNNPVEVAKGLDIPMLFMQGKQDWQVPTKDLELWRSGLIGSSVAKQSTFRLYDDVGHLFVPFKNEEEGPFRYDEPGHVSSTVIRDIVQWIELVSGR